MSVRDMDWLSGHHYPKSHQVLKRTKSLFDRMNSPALRGKSVSKNPPVSEHEICKKKLKEFSTSLSCERLQLLTPAPAGLANFEVGGRRRDGDKSHK